MEPTETTQAAAAVETVVEKPAEQVAAAPAKREFIIDGEVVQLTEEQVIKAANIGLSTLAKESKKPKEVAKPEVKTEAKVDTISEEAKRVQALESKLETREQLEFFEKVETLVDKMDILPAFKEDVQKDIVVEVAMAKQAARQNGQNPDAINVKTVAKQVQERWEKKLAALKPSIDMAAKAKDKETTAALVGKGNTAGQQADKPLGRDSFRDGSLAKRINQRITEMARRATE